MKDGATEGENVSLKTVSEPVGDQLEFPSMSVGDDVGTILSLPNGTKNDGAKVAFRLMIGAGVKLIKLTARVTLRLWH